MTTPNEIHSFKFKGAPIWAYMTHDHVAGIIAASGFTPPVIPPGCNTVRVHVTLNTGERAVICAQTRFKPTATDDEREVNGLSLIVLADEAWSEVDADKILDTILDQFLQK